jgi:hypothetical protein
VQNLVFRTIEMRPPATGHDARRGVGDEALLGPGRHRGGARGGAALRRQRLHERVPVVEQLARDAKVLQIYAGTDEIQITHIAKDLLRSPPVRANVTLSEGTTPREFVNVSSTCMSSKSSVPR